MRTRHRWAAAALATLALGGGALAASASSTKVTASLIATGSLVDGDDVTVELQGVDDPAPVFLTQCVLAEELRDGIACGRPATTTPDADGTASLLLAVRSVIGGDPGATCPPVDGRCVLRVTQGGFASARATAVSAVRSGDQPNPPPDGNQLVQDIGLRVTDPNDPGPTTTAPRPGSPPTSAPHVGGVTVPPPTFPTSPVDAPRGGPSRGSQAQSPTEVAGAAVDRDSIPETGNALTAALAAIGVGLVALGWVPASAWRRARLATAGTTPVK